MTASKRVVQKITEATGDLICILYIYMYIYDINDIIIKT